MGKKYKNDFKFSFIRSVSWAPIGFFLISQLNWIIDPEYPILIFDLEILKIESIIIILNDMSYVHGCGILPLFPQAIATELRKHVEDQLLPSLRNIMS